MFREAPVIGPIEVRTRAYHLVSTDSDKIQQGCYQKTDGRGRTCSRLASMNDDEPFLTFIHPDRASASTRGALMNEFSCICSLLEQMWSRNLEARAGDNHFDLTGAGCYWLSSLAIQHRAPDRSSPDLSCTSKFHKTNNHGDQSTPANKPVSTSTAI